MHQLYLIGFVQSLFFILLVITKKNKKFHDYMLMLYLLLLGSNLLFEYSTFSNLYKEFNIFIQLDILYWILAAPVLYIYVDSLIHGTNEFQKKHLWLLLPVIYVFIGFSDYLFLDSKLMFKKLPDSFLTKSAFYIWMYNSPIYYLLILYLLKKHRKNIQNYFSYRDAIDLKWLNYLVHGFAVFLLLLLISGILYNLFKIRLPFRIGEYSWLVLVMYIFGIGYFGYKQKGIFSEQDSSEININEEKIAEKKTIPEVELQQEIIPEAKEIQMIPLKSRSPYEKSGLSHDESQKKYQDLLDLMENEKMFFDCMIDLKSLALKMSISTNKLSQIINENSGKNFFDFINSYRIEEVIKRLKDSKYNQEKILSIAFDCGFNSKSAFYSMFKKTTTMTPQEFRTKYQTEISIAV